MPLYAVQCESGHEQTIFEHHPDDFGTRTYLCDRCGGSMGPIISFGQGLTAIEEGRPFLAENLGPEPVLVRSHKELERRLKDAGLDFYGQRRGMKGWWV